MKLDVKSTTEEIARVALKDLSTYGSFIFYALVAAMFLAIGAYAFFEVLVISLVAVTVVVMIIRLAYFKPRPGMKRKTYTVLYDRIDNSSFPSIHVARAVMLSAAFFRMVPTLWPVLLFLTAAVCASRIHFRRHDYTDITAGAIVGAILGWLFFIAL